VSKFKFFLTSNIYSFYKANKDGRTERLALEGSCDFKFCCIKAWRSEQDP